MKGRGTRPACAGARGYKCRDGVSKALCTRTRAVLFCLPGEVYCPGVVLSAVATANDVWRKGEGGRGVLKEGKRERLATDNVAGSEQLHLFPTAMRLRAPFPGPRRTRLHTTPPSRLLQTPTHLSPPVSPARSGVSSSTKTDPPTAVIIIVDRESPTVKLKYYKERRRFAPPPPW